MGISCLGLNGRTSSLILHGDGIKIVQKYDRSPQGRQGIYKDMMSKMYYVDGDLKNDTVQFDLAVERFKINNGYIDKRIKDLMEFETNSLYDIENFCVDNESNLPLRHRFLDVPWNVPVDSKDDADDNIQ